MTASSRWTNIYVIDLLTSPCQSSSTEPVAGVIGDGTHYTTFALYNQRKRLEQKCFFMEGYVAPEEGQRIYWSKHCVNKKNKEINYLNNSLNVKDPCQNYRQ